MYVIHLSDLHIGNSQREYYNMYNIIKFLGMEYKNVPILITGDLTHSGTKFQLKTARNILNELSLTNPILAVPGNHDYAWQGIAFRGWKNWEKYMGTPIGWGIDDYNWMSVDHEPIGIDGLGVFKHEDCVFFGIDSGDPNNIEHTARGYISTKLADALEKSLKQYEGQTRIVLLHHHPFYRLIFMALKGSKKLLKSIKDNCELLIFGHKHKYGLWTNEYGVRMIVASNKNTIPMSGNCLMGTLIDTKSFDHKIIVMGKE